METQRSQADLAYAQPLSLALGCERPGDAGLTTARGPHPCDDWRERPASFHIDRARRHLELLAAGDACEPRLAHAAAPLLMALECRAVYRPKVPPDGPFAPDKARGKC